MAERRPIWRIEVKARPAGTQGFTPLAKLWVMERGRTPGMVDAEGIVRTMSMV